MPADIMAFINLIDKENLCSFFKLEDTEAIILPGNKLLPLGGIIAMGFTLHCSLSLMVN
ncbi:hypothetical protein NRIC_14610 [Enterococcus florum]|uniref:Uncharacterized protein n=1 Tax=Enterococcus florum TaxID=2480627 RepID=A0A4P5P715_9ENTE|nr:hypothetical protein NRIC_14610 [Enterococcus florum]